MSCFDKNTPLPPNLSKCSNVAWKANYMGEYFYAASVEGETIKAKYKISVNEEVEKHIEDYYNKEK